MTVVSAITVYREILATVLIWRFGDLEANRQIKNRQLLMAGQRDRLSARGGSKFTFEIAGPNVLPAD